MSRRPYIGPSDAQANAEALARRSSTYADEHARSWSFSFDRPSHEPKGLRGYVLELRNAYADECPGRIHDHQLDAGGGPRFAPAFERFLYGRDDATGRDDDTYQTPFRACLSGMSRAHDLRTQMRARIAAHVTIGATSATEAAMAEGVPLWCAEVVALDALRTVWRRLSAVRLDLAKTESAA